MPDDLSEAALRDRCSKLRTWAATASLDELVSILMGFRAACVVLEAGLDRLADERCSHLVNAVTVPDDGRGVECDD